MDSEQMQGQMLSANRNETIDIMKGLLITLMVAGHAQIPIHRFIYLFHMSVFFMITGWLYNYDRQNIDIMLYVNKKISSLYYPYLKYNLLFVLLSLICPFFFKETSNGIVFSEIFKRVIGIFFFQGRCEMTGTSWFVFALFFAVVTFTALYKYIDVYKTGGVVLISFLVCYYTGNKMYTGVISSAMILVYLAYVMRKIIQKYNADVIFIRFNFITLLVSFILLVMLLYMNDTEIRLVSNQLVNPIYFITSSVIGFVFVYQLSKAISLSKKLSCMFSYLGRHTMAILFLHLLAFKLIAYIQINFYNLDVRLLSKHPVAYNFGFWWILYMLSGLVIPLCMEQVVYRVKSIISHSFRA